MFVKIIRQNTQTVFQCTSAEFDNGTGDIKILLINGDTHEENVEMIKGNSLYYMSDTGKTIDNKRW